MSASCANVGLGLGSAPTSRSSSGKGSTGDEIFERLVSGSGCFSVVESVSIFVRSWAGVSADTGVWAADDGVFDIWANCYVEFAFKSVCLLSCGLQPAKDVDVRWQVEDILDR